MSNRTLHHLIAARMDIKQCERRNAPMDECKQAVESLALVVGLAQAVKYQLAVRVILQLEREQLAEIENVTEQHTP
jgi:hypothetical protein